MELALKSNKLAIECWVGTSLDVLSLDLFGSAEEFETDDVSVPLGLDLIIHKLAEKLIKEGKVRNIVDSQFSYILLFTKLDGYYSIVNFDVWQWKVYF